MKLLNQAASHIFHWIHPPTRCLNSVRHTLAQQDLESAAEMIDQAHQKYPDRPDVNQLFVKIHESREDWEKVRVGIERIAANPKSSFDQALESARLFVKLGEPDRAIELYQTIGDQSRGFDAGLAWNSIAQVYMDRSEFEQALNAFQETAVRAGPIPWVPVINAIQKCSFESVFQCRNSMLERVQAEIPTYRMYKFISLLEQRLVEGGLCNQKQVVQSMRTASDIAFAETYQELRPGDRSPLKPKFLIIGAMKSGTTTLFELIRQHPRCLTSFDKEFQFFQFPHLSEEWYLEHFPRIDQGLGYVTFDASPGYYIFDIVDRVKQLLPDVKLIFIKRDPARRALSHIRHNVRVGMVDYGPEKAISGIDQLEQEIEAAPEKAEQIILDITFGKRKQNMFLALGCYELLLRRWKRVFRQDQLLTLSLEELSRSPQESMDRVFEFIDLESVQIEPIELNVGGYNDLDSKTQELLERLNRFYARVDEITGHR